MGQAQPAPQYAALVKKLTRFFFEQRGRVLASLAGTLSPTSPTSATSPTPPPPPLLALSTENSRLTALLQPLLQTAAAPPDCADCLAERAPFFEQINHTTLALLEQTLREAQAVGDSPDQLAARLKSFYNETTLPRAKELAATLAAAG